MKIILGTKLIDTIDIFHYWPNFISYLPSVINVMKRNKKIPKNIDIANNAIIATVISMHFPIFVFSSRTIFCLFRSKWFARLLEAHRYCVSSAAWKKILQYHKSNLIHKCKQNMKFPNSLKVILYKTNPYPDHCGLQVVLLFLLHLK